VVTTFDMNARLLLVIIAAAACLSVASAFCKTDADCPSSYCVNVRADAASVSLRALCPNHFFLVGFGFRVAAAVRHACVARWACAVAAVLESCCVWCVACVCGVEWVALRAVRLPIHGGLGKRVRVAAKRSLLLLVPGASAACRSRIFHAAHVVCVRWPRWRAVRAREVAVAKTLLSRSHVQLSCAVPCAAVMRHRLRCFYDI
jgi:hypothetical protein